MTGHAELPVIVNRSGGNASRAGEALGTQLLEAFSAARCPIDPELVTGDDVEATLQRHEGARRIVEIALDGEPRRLDLPLTLRIRPAALAVVAPPQPTPDRSRRTFRPT